MDGRTALIRTVRASADSLLERPAVRCSAVLAPKRRSFERHGAVAADDIDASWAQRDDGHEPAIGDDDRTDMAVAFDPVEPLPAHPPVAPPILTPADRPDKQIRRGYGSMSALVDGSSWRGRARRCSPHCTRRRSLEAQVTNRRAVAPCSRRDTTARGHRAAPLLCKAPIEAVGTELGRVASRHDGFHGTPAGCKRALDAYAESFDTTVEPLADSYNHQCFASRLDDGGSRPATARRLRRCAPQQADV